MRTIIETTELPSAQEVADLYEQWNENGGEQGKLLILPPGMKVKSPLPGKYAYSLRIDGQEATVTFQTYEELLAFIKWEEEQRA